MKNIKSRIINGLIFGTCLGISTIAWLSLRKPKPKEITYENYVYKYDCELMEKFNQKYNKNPERKEYLLCLEGKIQNDTIYLTGFHDPLYQIKKVGKVNYLSCFNSIGNLHPHYNGICQPSETDKKSAKSRRTKVKLIQCGESRIYGWVDRNWEKTYKLK